MELLHGLGDVQRQVESEHDTVSTWAVRDGKGTSVLLTNLALPIREVQQAFRLEWHAPSVERSGNASSVQMDRPPQPIAAIRFKHVAAD